MQTLNWLDNIGSIEQAIEALNKVFCWNITIVEGKGNWFVYAGDQVIFSADSSEVVDAFLYGMGLSLMSIP